MSDCAFTGWGAKSPNGNPCHPDCKNCAVMVKLGYFSNSYAGGSDGSKWDYPCGDRRSSDDSSDEFSDSDDENSYDDEDDSDEKSLDWLYELGEVGLGPPDSTYKGPEGRSRQRAKKRAENRNSDTHQAKSDSTWHVSDSIRRMSDSIRRKSDDFARRVSSDGRDDAGNEDDKRHHQLVPDFTSDNPYAILARLPEQ